VDGVTVDDKAIAPLRDVTLAAGTRRLQVEYGSLSLTSPQKTRFRFRLDGVDFDWVDVGQRRQASYTNLSPGQYRFRVAASDTSGAWSESEAAWPFFVAPRFYQTRLFALGCTGVVLLATGLAWNVRLRRERKRFSLILGERARLSREIHDTLLQGLVGIGLQCDALGNDLEQVAPMAKERFLRLRRETQRYIKEARHAIWRLRSSTSDRQELTTVLRRFGDPVSEAGGDFLMVVDGQPVALDEEVERQLERIAQEAITNAAHHAKAKRVEVALNYSSSEVVLRVSDNGCGFANAAHSEAAGHYGLLSMKERADSIRATFVLTSAAGCGTQVEVRVPLQHHLSLAAQTL
jgi:signal transduction histidine kinase